MSSTGVRSVSRTQRKSQLSLLPKLNVQTISKQKPIGVSKLSPAITPGVKLDQFRGVDTPTKQSATPIIGRNIGPTGGGSGFTPTPIITTGFGGGFGLPNIGMSRKRSKRRTSRKGVANKPSLLGIQYGRGKVSQRTRFTGLEIRGL